MLIIKRTLLKGGKSVHSFLIAKKSLVNRNGEKNLKNVKYRLQHLLSLLALYTLSGNVQIESMNRGKLH